MKNRASIFWCTGMSGAGKSTLAEYAKDEMKKQGFSVLVLDGDDIREKDSKKLRQVLSEWQ